MDAIFYYSDGTRYYVLNGSVSNPGYGVILSMVVAMSHDNLYSFAHDFA